MNGVDEEFEERLRLHFDKIYNKNVEIKVPLPNPEETESLIRKLIPNVNNTIYPMMIRQHDIFYEMPNGKLKLRKLDFNAELIYYQRNEVEGIRLSKYNIVTIDNPDAMDMIMKLTHPVSLEVKKIRRLYIIDQTRIHVDDVEGLGFFLELEVVLRETDTIETGKEIARDLMKKLNLKEEDLLHCSYIDLIHQKQLPIKSNS